MQKSADRQIWIVAFFVAVVCVIMMRNRNHTFHAMYSKPQKSRVMKLAGIITAAYLLGKGSQYLYAQPGSNNGGTNTGVNSARSITRPGLIGRVTQLVRGAAPGSDNGGTTGAAEPGSDTFHKSVMGGGAAAIAGLTVANRGWREGGPLVKINPDDDSNYYCDMGMGNLASQQCPVPPSTTPYLDSLFMNLITSG